MNNIYNIKAKGNRIKVILFMLVALFGTSCKKDIYKQIQKGEDKPLAITLSKSAVELHETDFANDAIEFTWTAGTNLGTNSSINYKLLIDKQGNEFKDAAVIDMGKAAFAKKYSVKDFNALLLDQLHLTPGVETVLDVRIESTVSGTSDKDFSGTVLTVTPYQPVTGTLFLIGDATPNGWDAGNATEMLLSSTTPGLFTWQGRLSSGEFKFITTKGQFLPSYNKGATATDLVYRTLDAEPDEKFRITTGNLYIITVNLLNLSINIVEGDEPPYTALWIVGDATPNGWNIDAPNPMRMDRSNPFVFTYSGELKAGEFKIPTATGNWGTDFYMPLVNYQDIALTDVQLVPGGSPDLKWKITNPGAYKIKLDLGEKKIEIKPFTPFTEIWLVGDATPNDWNIDNATPMVPDPDNPYVFTYTGPLKVGEFKFPLQKNFNGDYFMPMVAGDGPESHEMKFVPGGNPDNKWKITVPGTYKITMDQLNDTVNIEKL